MERSPTRRTALKCGLAAVAAGCLRSPGAGAAAPAPGAPGAAATPPAGYDFGLPLAGHVKALSPLTIAASPLSVGFETLDRKHFDPQKTYPYLAELGVKWARCQTGWARTETVRGQFDFDWLDQVVNSLRKLGVQPWFNLGYGNPLYSPECPDPAAVGWAPVFTEAAKDGWLRYVKRIAAHFGDRVKHWEIWNEPNIEGFWKPDKPKAADYVALVKMTAPEIRRLVPGAVIIGGAYAGLPLPFIRDCLEAGLAEHIDKLSYHPYRAVPESGYARELAALREAVAAHKKDLALWQGENGCPSQKGGAGALANLQWDETRQAKWLLRRIVYDLHLGVELTSYFHLVDLVGYRGSTNHKGLLRGQDYTPKPSFRAYQCLCALFDAQTRKAELAARVDAEQATGALVAAFTRSDRAWCAYWQPADLQKGWSPVKVAVEIGVKPDALPQPVLIDPLTSRAYKLPPPRPRGDGLRFAELPLLDYPLLIADAGVVAAA